MRVIFLNTYYKPHFGGIEGTLLSMSNSCKKKGIQPIIIASNLDLKRNPILPNEDNIDGIEIRRFPSNKVSGLGYFKSIFHHLRGIQKICGELQLQKDDIVIARSHMVCFVALFLKAKYKVNVIYIPPCIINDFNLQMFSRQQEYKKASYYHLKYFYLKYIQGSVEYIMQASALRFSSANLLPSTMFRNQFLAHYPFLSKERYTIQPFGVDVERFSPHKNKNKLYEERISKRVFVFLNSFSPKKGIVIGLNALSLIKELDFHLYMIGDGELRSIIEHTIKELGLSDKVTLLGAKDDPENYLWQADALFYPSLYESFGNSLVEGMSAGLPILGFKHNPPISELPNEELVIDGVSGYLANTTEKAYAEILKAFIQLSDQEIIALKERTRQYVVEKFSWDKYLEQVITICK
ncbi:MAG: glycosyl transferase group 1 [Chitinophagaceae bacterium]|nr:glycosyl transferase group 1 [Chitinophagaceae bacterium]